MIDGIDNIIEHFGVKGMKWGIRKDRSKSSGGKTTGEKGTGEKASEEKVKSGKSFKKGDVKKLTDKELRERINRLNMEKQYKDLIDKQNNKPAPAVIRGTKRVGSIVASASGMALKNYLTDVTFKALITRAAERVGAPGTQRDLTRRAAQTRS